MKKSLLVGFLSALLVCAFAVPYLWSAEAAPADGLKMAKTPQPVVFNHSTHKTAECKACHHKEEGGKVKKCSDAGCHDKLGKEDKSENSYYQAIHKMNAQKASCLACHKKTAGDDAAKKKELTGCKGSKCHKG